MHLDTKGLTQFIRIQNQKWDNCTYKPKQVLSLRNFFQSTRMGFFNYLFDLIASYKLMITSNTHEK